MSWYLNDSLVLTWLNILNLVYLLKGFWSKMEPETHTCALRNIKLLISHKCPTYRKPELISWPKNIHQKSFPILKPMNLLIRLAGFPTLWTPSAKNTAHRKSSMDSSVVCYGLYFPNQNSSARASLVAQWLRVCLPMQGTRVRALVWEEPTYRGATRPVSHSYWACTSGACAPQQERPR